ncbi:hypothetical protein AALO_G00020410 [Alosa alosa]|uniref:SWIM-type domain-containing protein n=1 Tax=Alosa alosa TaxID=278164 RepID=A0AAV6HEE2_9TELE|nr:hypothetical protein AALO_G00020410 [Alosa alosa]
MLTALPAELLSNFYKAANKVSDRSRQKGLQYAFEGYIQDIQVKRKEQQGIQIEAKAYRSQSKNEPPHILLIETEAGTDNIKEQHCSCKAGSTGFCAHIIGLIHTLDLCKAQHINAVPVQSSTSLPQQWHKPRGAKVAPQPVTAVVVARAKTERKRRPIFCQYSNDRAISEVTDQDLLLLRQLTGTPMSYIASKPQIDVVIGQEKYPLGSGLSYQLPLLDNTSQASSLSNSSDFPAFPLPPQPGSFCTVLNKVQMERFSTIVVSKAEAEALEKNTRQQSSNNIWHHVRSIRLTSSSFKRIISRRADFEQLAIIMQRKKKSIMAKAMKRGLELEPAAAAQYAVITGNDVQVCGFVINPNAPYLGTSPDRRVQSVTITWSEFVLIPICGGK